MNKKIICLVIVAVLILVGLFSIRISIDGFFFTTKYYSTLIDAYNESATYHFDYGDMTVKEEIGTYFLDDETCLFIGMLNDDRYFVVSEMMKKNDKYALKGSIFIYDFNEHLDLSHSNLTSTLNGDINWNIAYNEDQIKATNVKSVQSFLTANEKHIYLVIYND